jgi:hypothetical protein
LLRIRQGFRGLLAADQTRNGQHDQ